MMTIKNDLVRKFSGEPFTAVLEQGSPSVDLSFARAYMLLLEEHRGRESKSFRYYELGKLLYAVPEGGDIVLEKAFLDILKNCIKANQANMHTHILGQLENVLNEDA